MPENENIIDADVVGKSESAAEVKNTKPAKAHKTGHSFLWLAIILVLAVSAGGVFNLYKRPLHNSPSKYGQMLKLPAS